MEVAVSGLYAGISAGPDVRGTRRRRRRTAWGADEQGGSKLGGKICATVRSLRR